MNSYKAMLFAFLLISGAVLGVEAQPLERKSFKDLAPAELGAYRHAIAMLKASPGPQNYQYFADLHDLFIPTHGCEHGSDTFLPWHRWLLVEFEKALRATDPNNVDPAKNTSNVTIPYWDWTDKPTGQRYPAEFELNDPASEAGILFDETRNNIPVNAPAFSRTVIDALVFNANWETFGGGPRATNRHPGQLENPYHNNMHASYISGDMGDPSSAAEDPIFWSFHCFIDRLFDRWQKSHQQQISSQDAALIGFDNTPTPKVRDTLDTRAMGYFYSYKPGEIAVAPLAAATPTLHPEAHVLLTVGGPPYAGDGPFVYAFNKPAGPFSFAHLYFEKVHAPTTFSYSLDAYIHPAGTMYTPEQLAGSLTIWRGHASTHGDHPEHENHAMNLALEVSKTLKNVVAAADPKWTLTLVVKPIKTLPSKKDKTPTPAPTAEEVKFGGLQLIMDKGGPLQSK